MEISFPLHVWLGKEVSFAPIFLFFFFLNEKIKILICGKDLTEAYIFVTVAGR